MSTCRFICSDSIKMQSTGKKKTNSECHTLKTLLKKKKNNLNMTLKKSKKCLADEFSNFKIRAGVTNKQVDSLEIPSSEKQEDIQTFAGCSDNTNHMKQFYDCVLSETVCNKDCSHSLGLQARHVLNKKTVLCEESGALSTSLPDIDQYVALDCEFVGVGPNRKSALARCSIVDYSGHVILDLFVKPEDHITDYRTPWSGIHPKDMKRAIPFKNARNMVIKTIKNKIIVGHALHNDFRALGYFHPAHSVRDTSRYKPLKVMANCSKSQPVSLKQLTQQLCGYEIQRGEHCSIEDSRATMSLFKLVRLEWENKLLAQKSEDNLQDSQCVRTISESSDESYFSDNLWPADL